MHKQFRISPFILLLIISIKLFSNDEFYTISICSTTTYKDALFCKNKILKDYDDISIVKVNERKYRTNYGVFNSLEDAKKVEKTLEGNLKKQKPFIIKIDKNKPDFEDFEIFSKNQEFKNENIVENIVEKKVEKEIIIEEKKVEDSVKSSNTREKIAYLTFDDGPIHATKNILEIIEQENVPVSMFFIGKQIENFRNIYENALTYNNVTIGNHTYSHANGKYKQFYSDSDLVVEDIKKANIIISKDRNSTTQSSFLPTRLAGRNVFRLPLISRNDNGLPKEQIAQEWLGYEKLFNEGFYIYGWDVEWKYEASGKPIESVVDIVNTMEKIHAKNHSRLPDKVVLLMHDRMFNNRFNGKENLQTLIQLLKNNGWKFANIERYF